MRPLVLDTNIVLDLFVFADAAAAPLHQALHARRHRWIATAAMREELQRVLAYPHLAARLQFHEREPGGVLAAFDACVEQVAPPSKVPATCSDADDQKFIDLAVTHRALLLSKDRAVLSMRRRLQRLGVDVTSTWTAEPIPA